jgi:hypothetical protein
MSLNWKGNDGPLTSNNGGKPETSHGPGMISNGTSLQMIYVGKSRDNNLWDLSTIAAIFPQWDNNSEIDDSQTIAGDSRPRASFRPALAVFNNQNHMVYAGNEGRNLWWAWSQPDGSWNNLQLPWSGTNFNPQPALAVHEGKLFLAWYDYVQGTPASQNGSIPAVPDRNYIRYSSLDEREPLEVSSWAHEQIIADGAQLPALASYSNGKTTTLYLLATSPPNLGTQLLISQFNGNNWAALKPFAITGAAPASKGGIGLAVFNSMLYLVYPDAQGVTLRYAWIDTLNVTHGDIQIKVSNGSTPKTSAPLGLCVFNGALCVGYKGENGNNVWFCYGTP